MELESSLGRPHLQKGMEFLFGRAQARSSCTWTRCYARLWIYLWMQSYLDAVLNVCLRGKLLQEAQSGCVGCQPWGQAVPYPRDQHQLETTSQMDVKAVQLTHAEYMHTYLTGGAAADVCFRNRELGSLSHEQNMPVLPKSQFLLCRKQRCFTRINRKPVH